MTKALENAKATRVGTLALQNPVIASILGVAFLGEILLPIQWVGMAIVLVSLFMFNMKRMNT